jgi:hypothetical protein
MGSNSNSSLSLPPCCVKLYNEKEMLKRALQKEREKRQVIESAYNKLYVEIKRYVF